MRKILLFLTIVLLVIITAGCGKESKAKEDHVSKVTIGYFPNLNHAPAIVAKEKQLFEKQLGDDIEVEYITFQIIDRKSTRLNSSHVSISYAVFCLKQKTRARCRFIPTAMR